MSNMSITLPQSAISLVSFLPACMYYLLVSRLWTDLDPGGVTYAGDSDA